MPFKPKLHFCYKTLRYIVSLLDKTTHHNRAGTVRINACGDSRLRGQRSRKPIGFRLWVVHEREARISLLTAENSVLTVEKQMLQPKADYFDELVDRNLLTNFRETAKQLSIKQNDFVNFLLEKKYIYRDKRGKLMPYADRNTGLFEIKECFNEKTQWCGTQTLITPKGRETFRLLYLQP